VAVLYDKIVRQAALRINAITGAIATTLETNYSADPVTAFQSTIFPQTAIYDAVITTEGRLATAIAETSDHPFRNYISSQTATLASGDSIPSVDVSSNPIIGVYGKITDADDPLGVCTEQPTEVVRRWNTLSTYLKQELYYYALDGVGILHTRPDGVVIQVCVYNATTQRTSLLANGNIILADGLEEAYVNGTVSALIRDDEFMGQASVYRGYFNDTLQSISGSMPSAALTGPMPVPTIST
jgi:hypothetical protein